jgi:hypothetical protein
MPCPIEIRKTIENSINELLPDQQSVMADSVAKRIVKELNTLWESAISRVVPYSGQGGSFVKINSLDDAVNKEYKRQLEAEKKFERDLDFFKGDEALVEQEQRDLFLQKSPAAIKPGVEELFNENPELATIGTQEQYSQYLDTIFPDSQVMDIVYHGTDVNIEKFDKSFRGKNTGEESFTDGTPIDSKNAFFFSSDKNSTFQYSFIKQLNKISDLTNALLNLLIDFNQKNASKIRTIDSNFADFLNVKRKEFNDDLKFKEYLKVLHAKYSSANDNLGVGFLNQYNNYINSQKQIKYLEENKNQILKNSNYKSKTIYIYDEKYNATKIYEDGLIYSTDKNINKKYIYNLTSKEYDNLINRANKINNDFFDSFEKNKIKYKLTPKTYSVILNITNPLKKDFEGIPFVSQIGGEKSAQYEASVLTNDAVKKGKDSVVFENIKDPYLATNYGVFEPEQIHILGSKQDVEGFKEFVAEEQMLQKPSTETLPSNASPKTLKLIKDFLQKIGVDVNVVKEIVVNGVKYDANGVAQIMQQLISVVEGKEAQALPEEAMHFAVAIIKQTNPKLYQKLLKEINGYEMLTQVFRTYGNDPLYQKDGKPDVIKLKEEAIAKVLVEKIINQAEGVLDSSDNLRKVQSWWKDILDWIKDLLYIKSGLDQVTIDIISGKEIGTVEDVSEQRDELFLQKSKQDNFYDTIVETSNRIDKPTDIQKKYVIDGKEVSRVSDVVKTHYDNKQKNRELLKDEYDIALDELRKEKGTAGHADLEHAFSLFIDENGYLRDPQVRKYKRDNDNYSPELGNNVLYDRLVDNLEQRLESYPEGTRFIKEVAIYNGKNLAGTVDFIAITKDGKLDILDWKFMNLNLEYYKDVPWYKIEAWNIQMNEYKKILMDNYGVKPKDFGQTRMIPILAEYSRGRKDKDGSIIELPKLIGIKIGDVNVKNISEEEDFLLPVPTKDEISDNVELDTLIKKLNAAYERFAKEKITPDQKEIKREQLQSLFKAIRRLQIKRDVKPLIEQFKLLKLKTDKFYEKYNNLYKDVDDSVKISEAEMNDFSRESESILNALTTYVDIDLLLKNVVDQDLRNELRDMAYDARENIMKISKIDQDFTSEVIAKREKVNDLLSPEKIIRGLTKAFSSTSTIQVKSIQLLFKKADKALGRATFATQEEGAKLMNIKEKYDEWAKSKGLTSKNFFSFIKKKDSNELIDQYKKEFYKELKKAVNNRDVNWIKNNVNIDLLKEEIEEKKNKELEFVNNKPRTGTPEETLKEISKEVSDIERLYNISSDDSKGWFLYDTIKNFPLDKWETQEWKTLNSLENKPAKDFYDYIIEKNKEYADLGYISKQQSRVFLPYVKGSITESLVKGEKISLGEEFWRNISIDASDVGFGQINPETGKPINTIPKYFTTPFSGTVSEDLFKTMLLYNEAALRYKYLSDIEDQVKAIARVEKNKKSILISTIGDVRRNELGDIQFDPEGGDGNYQLLDSMIKAIIYGQKFVDNQNFDAALLKLGSWGKKINEKLGIKVFPEDMSNRVISLSKSIDSLNRYFTLSTLGLNVGSSLSNLFGGTAQSIINSGKYFTKNDFISSEYQIMTKKFEGLDKEKYLRAFEYFLPITDSYTRDLARQLSVNVVTQESFQDFLMILMKSGDRLVQSANFLAFLENSIVIDNEVVNAREYLRQLPEYKGKYEGSSEDRQKFNQKFEEDVKKLIEEKGVLKLSKVENGKLVIPGVERMSDSVLELRRKVQQLTKDALGNLSDADVRMINLIIIGKSFMVFKNWIPRLVDVRFGGLKYNAGSDAYEWGRIRTLMNYLHEGLVNNHKGLLGLITGNEDGVKLMRDSFEKRAEKYERETGRKLEMDEVLYMDLYQSNLKSAARDMIVLTALAGLTWAIKASIPDDEEDEAVINQFKFAAKLSDKLLDELMYFYNPTSILNLVGSGPFPAMSMVNNSFKGIMNFFKEMFAIVTGDEKTQDDIKVLKYVMRSFPFTNQMSGYLPLIYPELAKDLGIRVQTNYGIR